LSRRERGAMRVACYLAACMAPRSRRVRLIYMMSFAIIMTN
jgi:hypothetical protein